MRKLMSLLSGRSEAALIKQHKKNIDVFNKSMTLGIVRIITIILLLAVITSPMADGFRGRVVICTGAFSIFVILLVSCKKGVFDNSLRFTFYLVMFLCMLLSISLSVFTSPDQKATILLGIFFIVPMAHIDCFNRKLGFCLMVFLVHTILAFEFKGPALASVDALNSLCFIAIGAFIGHVMQTTKLTSFELEKRLLFERETDILTGLKNRRKMIELFTMVEAGTIPTPNCAILLDIDNFKQYNDQYGHGAGDEFLGAFGAALLKFEERFNIKIFRYGGEEFSAFMWEYTAEEQNEILELLRKTVEELPIERGRTVSIGYFNCINQDDVNLENALEFADIALYQAKGNGRNQVVHYDEMLCKGIELNKNKSNQRV